MITPAEERFIRDHASVPEHLPYVQAVSRAAPHRLGACMYFGSVRVPDLWYTARAWEV
jgi:hypothetical protein